MRFIQHHFIHYFAIFLLFAITVYAISSTIPLLIKWIIIMFVAGVYFFWAIWQHGEDKALTFSTLFEYCIITLLLIWLLFSIAI